MTNKLPHTTRAGLILELANMYEDELAFIRETISNIWDQRKHPNAKGKKVIARIYVRRGIRKVEIVDELTGITDTKDFTAIGTAEPTRESGKTVGDETNSYAKINPDITGQKHVGKMSQMYASSTGTVEYFSNNGTNGHYLKCDYTGWEEFDGQRFKVMDTIKALPHVGLKVVINDAKDDCLSIRKVENATKKWFSILLKKKKIEIEIIDVDNAKTITVIADPSFKTEGETTDDTLAMTIGGNIRVNLDPLEKPSLKNNIDVYQKEIFVRSIKVPAMCCGYVNYDGLELQPTRETYKRNAEFDEKLLDYCIRKFGREEVDEQPSIEKKESKHLLQIVNEVFSAIQQVDADLSIDLFGPQEDTGIKGQVTSGQKEGEWKDLTNVGIAHDAKIGQTVIFTGDNGPIEGGGGGGGDEEGGNGTRIIENGGNYSVKIKQSGDNKDEKEKTVQPDIKVKDSNYGDLPTLFFKEIPLPNNRKAIWLCINRARPASRVLTKVAGIDKLRDITADKIIRAAYRLKYKGNNVEEFEDKVDQTWNAMIMMKGATK